MGNLINTGVPALSSATPGSTVPLNIFNGLDKDGAGVFKEDLNVVLAVYDLDQYLAHQASLPDAGFRELDTALFSGAKTRFDDLPPDHEVKPGSGVLFRATLKLGKKTVKGKDGSTTIWFVKERIQIDRVAEPAYTLDVRHQAAIGEDGKPLAPAVAGMRSIGVGGASLADFRALTRDGHRVRRITFRFLSEDQSTVLLSQLNPAHNPMNETASINRAVAITYQPQGQSPRVGQDAAPLADPPPPEPVVPRLDLTGFYVLQLDDADFRKKAFDLVSPAGLFIHHVGRAACGWYYPVSEAVLDARQPLVQGQGARLFPADVRDRLPGLRPMCFAMGTKVEGFGPVFPIECFFAEDPRDPKDPDILRTVKDKDGSGPGQGPADAGDSRLIPASKRTLGTMAFTVKDVTFKEGRHGKIPTVVAIQLDGTIFNFRRVHGNTRLPYSVLDQMLDENAVPADLRDGARKALLGEHMEPLPPGTLAALVGWITSKAMIDLVKQVAEEQGSGPDFIRRPNQIRLNKALEDLAANLNGIFGTSTLPDVIVAMVRSLAAHQVFKDGDTVTTLLDMLEDIAMTILEESVLADIQLGALPEGRPNPEDFEKHANDDTFSGYGKFHIHPKRTRDRFGKPKFKQFLYRFAFKQKALDKGFGLVLAGSIGAFNVTISKLDADTKEVVDKDKFPPTDFIGILGSGGVGLGFSLPLAYTPGDFKVDDKAGGQFVTGEFGAKFKPGAKAGGAEDVDIFSMVDIKSPTDFVNSIFKIFVQHLPSGGVSAGPFSLGSGTKSETFFSISLPRHSPPCTLEAEMKKGYEIALKTPDAQEVAEYVKGIVDSAAKKEDISFGGMNATLYNLSVTVGWLIDTRNLSFVPRDLQIEDDMVSLARTPLKLEVKVVGAHFEKNSAFVSEDAREILELKLAVLRKVLEFPGWIDVQGTASPEWSTAKRKDALELNSRLSFRRANNILRCIFAAAGQPGQGIIPADKEFIAIGKGANPFLSEFRQEIEELGGDFHLDPFSPDASTDDGEFFIAFDKATFYPGLRRVDIFMNGVYALRILGD